MAFISSQRLLEILLTFLPLHPTITGCLIRLACQKFKLAQLTCATLTKKKLNPGHFFKPPQTKLHKHFWLVWLLHCETWKSLIREDKTVKKSYFDMISLKERWKIYNNLSKQTQRHVFVSYAFEFLISLWCWYVVSYQKHLKDLRMNTIIIPLIKIYFSSSLIL